MAQSISFVSGSPLAGSPLSYSVTPNAHQSAYTFHRVVLNVYAGLESDDDYTEFQFSVPVSDSSPVVVDVSSALRAVADKYDFAPVPPSRYPYIKFRIEAWDDWMVDGTLYSEMNTVYYPSLRTYLYAFMGGFTDMERLSSQNADGLTGYRFTRKPVSTPEIVHLGKEYVRPANFTASMGYVKSIGGVAPLAPTDGPRSYIVHGIVPGLNNIKVEDDTDDTSDNEIIQLYAIPSPTDSFNVRFVNGLGCLESIHLSSLEKVDVDIVTENYVIARQETFKDFSRGDVVKKNNHEKWSLTSGPVDRMWASWFIHEFLMTRRAWIKVGEVWVPAHVLPEETITLIDRTGGTIEVRFVMQLDIEGSPVL